MKISEVIQELERIQEKEGDLFCFSSSMFEDSQPYVAQNEGQYPEEWTMPEKFVILGYCDD